MVLFSSFIYFFVFTSSVLIALVNWFNHKVFNIFCFWRKHFYGYSALREPFIPSVIRRGVAVYVVYCGPDNGIGDIVDAPRKEIAFLPHYFITDNINTSLRANSLGWNVITLAGTAQVGHDANLKCKIPRTLPSLFQDLDAYKYLVYIDTKEYKKINVSGLLPVIKQLQKKKKWAFLLHPHPNFPYGGPRAEFHAAMHQERYKIDELKYAAYINSREGHFTAKNVFAGGLVVRNMNHYMVNHIGMRWYGEILASGIDDQISLPFVYERYKQFCGLLQ